MGTIIMTLLVLVACLFHTCSYNQTVAFHYPVRTSISFHSVEDVCLYENNIKKCRAKVRIRGSELSNQEGRQYHCARYNIQPVDEDGKPARERIIKREKQNKVLCIVISLVQPLNTSYLYSL